jgi:hypothetical protein
MNRSIFGPPPIETHPFDTSITLGPATFPTPWFLDRPPWDRIDSSLVAQTLEAAHRAGIVPTVVARQTNATLPSPRICPYTPERFGLSLTDVVDATAIDIQLHACGLEHPIESVRGWMEQPKRAPEQSSLATIPWPADVPSLALLGTKVQSIRALAPSSAVMASIDVAMMAEAMGPLAASGVDAILIRAAANQSDGLASQLASAARLAGGRSPPLLVSIPLSHPHDAVGWLQRGALGVAVESLLPPLAAPLVPTAVVSERWSLPATTTEAKETAAWVEPLRKLSITLQTGLMAIRS